jgi:hypothetical protein
VVPSVPQGCPFAIGVSHVPQTVEPASPVADDVKVHDPLWHWLLTEHAVPPPNVPSARPLHAGGELLSTVEQVRPAVAWAQLSRTLVKSDRTPGNCESDSQYVTHLD